jgi:hypothetical protein
MEPPEYRSIVPLEVLAASLVMRLRVDELEWLWRELAQRTEEKRRKAGAQGEEPFVLAGYRDAWNLRAVPRLRSDGATAQKPPSRQLDE